MRIAIKTRIAALAAGALMIGLTAAAPTARAAEIVDRSAIVSDATPLEMQRRGGFRAGPRIAGRPGGGFRPGPYRGGPRRGNGNLGAAIGIGAAALIIGGAAAAASQQRREEYRECWVERRWVDGPYGPERRNIRVCN
ncbi:hypothetical protein E8L99_14975 [Phreatobacter aquaticus]|uniref:Uncharacterized protein n=1 Tax=Phreatobacter aquaticus TaxID=2570229 RepID=A0A4D7QPV9_9HYPH|nr:hypothetical protein [Phreatobacter aquaticus]QCK86967.1 hypothetical protein E8L99_14975 [Phreatobacter aquaticus]